MNPRHTVNLIHRCSETIHRLSVANPTWPARLGYRVPRVPMRRPVLCRGLPATGLKRLCEPWAHRLFGVRARPLFATAAVSPTRESGGRRPASTGHLTLPGCRLTTTRKRLAAANRSPEWDRAPLSRLHLFRAPLNRTVPGTGQERAQDGTCAQCTHCAILGTGACQRPKAARSALFCAEAEHSAPAH